jgi:ribokinase
VAVVGHVEWVEFVPVEHVPVAGEIVVSTDTWQQPAGGGGVAAVRLAELAGSVTFYTALGDDELGRRAADELRGRGIRVEVAWRPEPQRRGFVYLDAAGERTITVIGEKLVPRRDDPLPWDELGGVDAVFFVCGDAGAVRAARAAGVVTATTRELATLAQAGVRLDAVIGSGRDRAEAYRAGDLEPPPRLAVRTAGAQGGSYELEGGPQRAYAAAPLPGPVADSYGCGDSFAAGVTYGLGARRSVEDAVAVGARCGAAAIVTPGAYGRT